MRTTQVQSRGRPPHSKGAFGANCSARGYLCQRGSISEEDARSAREFNHLLTRAFAENLASGATVTVSNLRAGDARYAGSNIFSGKRDAYWATDDDVTAIELVLDFGKPVSFNLVSMREYLSLGQRIDAVALDAWDGAK